MKIEIASSRFSATVDSFGAGIQSLKDWKVSTEYIWQRNPEIWDRSAPVLFPVVGRMNSVAHVVVVCEDKVSNLPRVVYDSEE